MRRLWRQLGIIWLMMAFWFQRFKFQRFEFISQMAVNLVDIGLIGLMWYLVAQNSSLPLSPGYIVSYYLLIAVATTLMFSQLGVGNIILKEIKDGSFNQHLIKPLNPIVASYATMLGRTLLSRMMYLGFYIVAAATFLHVSPARIPVLLAVLAIGFSINFGFNVLAACLGFYIVDASGFKNAILHGIRFLQGALIPLALMPASAQRLLEFTPFPHSMYWPIIALRGDAVPLRMMAIGLVWAVVIPFLAITAFRRSMRNYEGVGI